MKDLLLLTPLLLVVGVLAGLSLYAVKEIEQAEQKDERARRKDDGQY